MFHFQALLVAISSLLFSNPLRRRLHLPHSLLPHTRNFEFVYNNFDFQTWFQIVSLLQFHLGHLLLNLFLILCLNSEIILSILFLFGRRLNGISLRMMIFLLAKLRARHFLETHLHLFEERNQLLFWVEQVFIKYYLVSHHLSLIFFYFLSLQSLSFDWKIFWHELKIITLMINLHHQIYHNYFDIKKINSQVNLNSLIYSFFIFKIQKFV